MERRPRWLRLLLLLAAGAVAFVLSRAWPTDHTVHIVLGDSAPVVREVRVRYSRSTEGSVDDAWLREARFAYAPGQAPRVVSHEARLPPGEYDVEAEATVGVRARGGPGVRTVTARRRVRLDTGAASIDLAPLLRDSLEETPPLPPEGATP